MVSVFVLMISAKPEPDPEELEEFDDPEPPRLPAVVPVPDEPFEEEDELDDDDEFPEPPPDTASPGVRLETDAIVPLTGAYSFVLVTAVSALCTPAWAEYTAAWAEAMLPGDGVVVVVVGVVAGRVVAGTVTVTVRVGVLGFESVLGFVPGWNEAYSTVASGAK
jgi:hypothetical protein